MYLDARGSANFGGAEYFYPPWLSSGLPELCFGESWQAVLGSHTLAPKSQLPPNRDHKALNRGTLWDAGNCPYAPQTLTARWELGFRLWGTGVWMLLEPY